MHVPEQHQRLDDSVSTLHAVAVLDPYVIRRLGEELGDERAAARVAGRFLSLLAARAQRLRWAVADHDGEDALDCVLSLKVTAAMVGGRSLQAQAERLEALLRADRWLETPLVLAAVGREVAPLTEQLQALVADLSHS